MYSASEGYRATVRTSGHEALAGLDVLDGAGSVLRSLMLTSGSVTEDAAAAVRRTLDATVVDDGGLTPLSSSVLAPGALLRPWRGVRLPDGSVEAIPLGVLVAGKPEADLDTGTIHLAAEDRSAPIAAARLIDPWPVPAGSWLSEAVSALLADRLPGCPAVRLAAPDVQLSGATFLPAGADTDPWDSLVSTTQDAPGLVWRAGRRLWFDADGVPTLYDLDAGATMTDVDSGRLVLGAKTAIDASTTYGVVCATSNVNDDAPPLRSVVYDLHPASPTWSKRVYFAQLDALTTQATLDAAAGTLLTRVSRVRGQVSCQMPPDATVQAGDVLNLTGGALSGMFEVARITTPLTAGLSQVDFTELVV